MKQTIYIFVGVIVVLAIVVFIDGSPETIESGGVEERSDTSRSQLSSFWDAYREATRYRIDGQYEKAIDAYERSLDIFADHEDALYYVGNMYLEVGRYEKAEWAWRSLVDINPRSSRGFSQLGNLYLCHDDAEQHSLQDAEAAFHQALALNKEETGSLLRLGQIALLRGDLARAEEYMEDVTKTNFRNRSAFLMKGYIDWMEGNLEGAVSNVRRVQSLQSAEAAGAEMAGEGDTAEGLAPMTRTSASCSFFDGVDHFPVENDETSITRNVESYYSRTHQELFQRQ